ncbi:MAG: metallophosphoesterase [Chlorobiaceae bacterium]|jgi:manganese-dependent ADP-ribose/CDP-alcohol diphosphatase
MASSCNHALIRFGIITDIHFSTENETAAAVTTAAELRACLDDWQRHDIDFLLQLGDQIKGSDGYKDEEFRQVSSILNTFHGTIHHVLGNHCLALPRQTLMASLGLQTPFYAFTIRGFRFLVLDGMDVSVLRIPETPEDAETLAFFRAHPELHDYCGAVGIQQRLWLTRELEEADRLGESVIVVCHFPLLPETTDQKHGLLWNHREIAELVASSPAVKACLSGHYHYGGYALLDGIHFVVLPAFVNRHEHPDFTCGMVELYEERMVIRNQLHETLYDLTFH